MGGFANFCIVFWKKLVWYGFWPGRRSGGPEMHGAFEIRGLYFFGEVFFECEILRSGKILRIFSRGGLVWPRGY